MSVIERSQSFVKEMNELNVSGISQYFEIQREALEGFVSANRERFAALRDVKGIGDVVSVEREFYAAVQKGVTSSVEKQTSLARDNWSTAGQLVRGLFGNQTEADSGSDEKVAEVA
jgi:hypothetical protein